MKKDRALAMYQRMVNGTPVKSKIPEIDQEKASNFKEFIDMHLNVSTNTFNGTMTGAGTLRTAKDLWKLCLGRFPQTKYHQVLKHLMDNYNGWYCETIRRRVWFGKSYWGGRVTPSGALKAQLNTFKELDL